jgi:hypothetical protein
MGFLRKVINAAKSIDDKITQDRLAEAMEITTRRLQQRISDNTYTWLEIKKYAERAKEKKTKELTP